MSTSRIVVTCPAQLRAAVQFAENNGCTAELAKSWLRLLSLLSSFDPGDNPETNPNGFTAYAEIWADWAPYSFAWVVKQLNRGQDPREAEGFLMNGGLIYHGPVGSSVPHAKLCAGAPRLRDTGAGGPDNFAASLGRAMAGADRVPHEWSIHT